KLSADCLAGTKLIDVSPHREKILHLMNDYRNKVAGGYTKTMMPAARMARMDWSTELEFLASIYVAQCSSMLRPCMSSPQFTTVGSIYDGVTFLGKFRSSMVPMLLEETINGWFEPTRFVTNSMVSKINYNLQKRTMRQVVLLMTDRNNLMGCRGLYFEKYQAKNFRLVCTFATDLIVNVPIYNVSLPAGRHCARIDATYENLCALGEKYNNRQPYSEVRMLDSP
ncbi:hypothetical protein KR093_004741, partial [Drosophila rubida]